MTKKMNNLLENLNKEQLEAVTHKEGPLLIIAGAGTGKTTVVTQRIAYLIEQGKAKADEILALTFTEKAAGEMEERVDRLLPMGYTDLWISTFHSFGERILNTHGLDIGLPTEPKLLNEFEQYALVKNNFDKFDLDYYRPLGNPTKFIQAMLKHFSRLKDEDVSPADYLKYAEELRENMDAVLSGAKVKKNKKVAVIASEAKQSRGETDVQDSRDRHVATAPRDDKVDKELLSQEVNRINEVANAYHVYQQLLLDNNALDFGDLINYTLKLFRERPLILEKYRQQFKYIMLDEFQDTNWSQYELIKLLAAPRNNLVVVGDDDQSVYKFRGASVSNILQFKKDFKKSKEIVLIKNYRNAQAILDMSYDFIQLNNPNRLEVTLKSPKDAKGRQIKLSKKLLSQKDEKGVIEVIEGKDLQDEMRQVVEKIAEIRIESGNKISWNEFAVLVRANSSAHEICAFLEASGLPYQFLASRGLYAKAIIMDIVAYLKLLDDYHEGSAMYRVLKLPFLKFSDKEITDLNYISRKKSWSLYNTLKDANAKLGPATAKKCRDLLQIIEKHTALARDKSVLEVFLAFLNDSGYLKYISELEEEKARELISYLNQFKKRIEKFMSGSDDISVSAFLKEYNLEIDAGETGSISPDYESGPEAIKIMTIHAAKGLEFKYVFITNLVDKRFPTIARKEPIEIPDALVKEILPEGDIHLEEERRLMYVAMTRAEKGLYLSWAKDYGGARDKKPSRFLGECGFSIKNESHLAKATQDNKLKIKNSGQELSVKKTNDNFGVPGGVAYAKPTYFSFSKLTAFLNCPYQYRFNYILQVPTRNKHYFSFGKTMHSTLQKIFQLVQARCELGQGNLFDKQEKTKKEKLCDIEFKYEEIKNLYEESWIDEWYQSAGQKKEYKKKGEDIIREFLKIHNNNWPKVMHMEKGFKNKINFNDEYYTIGGAIDRIDEINGKIKIVDYKTGTPKEKLSFDDKFQLLIYQQAIQDVFRQEIHSLSFYYLENNSEIEFLGTEKELSKSREKIINTISDIHKNEFPPKPSQLCKFCDFFDICEYRKS
jgi:DNA helicase-2/ATP-dependent DNA helicase PcrA